MKIELDSARYASPGLRATVLHRDKYRCRYCQRKVTNDTANIDHVIAWKHGGTTVLRNLVASCKPCNKSKANYNWQPKSINYKPKKQTPVDKWAGMDRGESTPYDDQIRKGIEARRSQKSLRRGKVKHK